MATTKIVDIEITVGQALRAIGWFLIILFLILLGFWFFTNYEIKNRFDSGVKKQEEAVAPPCPVDDKKTLKQISVCPGITSGNQKGVTDPNDLYDSQGTLPASQQQNPGIITNSDQVQEIAKQQVLQETLNEIKNF